MMARPPTSNENVEPCKECEVAMDAALSGPAREVPATALLLALHQIADRQAENEQTALAV